MVYLTRVYWEMNCDCALALPVKSIEVNAQRRLPPTAHHDAALRSIGVVVDEGSRPRGPGVNPASKIPNEPGIAP